MRALGKGLEQAGFIDIATDGNGDGTGAVVFTNAFPVAPVLTFGFYESELIGTISATSPTRKGFTYKVDGAAASATITCCWQAQAPTQ